MRKIVFIVSILFSTLLVSAQTAGNDGFYPGWYVGGNLGTSWLAGERIDNFSNNPDSRYSLGRNSGSMFRAEIGYNYSPVWGIRGFAGFTQNHWPEATLYYKEVISFASKYVTGDVMMNISNYLEGQNLARSFDFLAFAGTGFHFRNRMTRNGAGLFSMIGRLGAQTNFILNEYVDLKAIFELNIVDDNYNGFEMGSKLDIMPALSVGLTYYIDFSRFQSYFK